MKNYYLIFLLIFISSINSFSQVNEDFENSFPAAGWEVVNGGSSSNWEQSLTVGFGTSNQSAFFDNFTTPVAPTFYVLRIPTLDLSGVTDPELIFEVAYARYDATHNDKLRLFYNINNTSWTVFQTYADATLTDNPDQTTYFTPTNNGQWKTITVDLSAYNTETNIRFAFEFNSDPDGGNVMYIDNVEIADAVLSTSNESLVDFSVYPNPTEGIVSINTSLENLNKGNFKIRNLLGQEYKNFSMSKNSNTSYKLNLENFSSGMYFVTVSSDKKSTTKKLYIK